MKDIYTFWEVYWIVSCVTTLTTLLIMIYPTKQGLSWGGKIVFICLAFLWPVFILGLFFFNLAVRIWPKMFEVKK